MLSFDYFMKSILRSWRYQPAVQGAALLVLSCTLTIVFTFYLVFSNIERMIVSWGADLEMNIYLEDELLGIFRVDGPNDIGGSTLWFAEIMISAELSRLRDVHV